MAEKKKNKLDLILDKLTAHDKKFAAQDQKFDNIIGKLIKNDEKFDELDNKITTKFSDVLGGLDRVMGELETARQERVFAKAEDDRQNLRLNDLEGRAKKVEVKIGA